MGEEERVETKGEAMSHISHAMVWFDASTTDLGVFVVLCAVTVALIAQSFGR